MKTICTVLLFVALIGCTAPYRSGQVVEADATFPGLMELAGENSGIDIISIHGMCTQDKSWAYKAADRISKHMPDALPNRDNPNSWDYVLVNGEYNKLVKVLKTELVSRKVNFYAIIWSNMTATKKKKLCPDSGIRTPSCPDPNSRHQAYINNKLKSVLMNDCLADAIIYIGPTGEEIRRGIKAALEAIGSHRSSQRPTAIIAESLGSKIITDIFRKDSYESLEALKALTSTRMIYLAANQVRILDLGKKHGVQSQEHDVQSLLDVLKQVQHNEDDKISKNGYTILESNAKHVAFTDPNDLLSYEVERPDDGDHINVRVSNAFAPLGLFANPWKIHTGYLKNACVWEYIMCGHPRTC